MSNLRKAFALSVSDWILIAQACMWFGLVEVGLNCLSLKKLLQIIQREKDGQAGKERNNDSQEKGLRRLTPERVAYCAGLAARLHALDATCLKKALVLHAMLTRRGFNSQLLIGASRAEDGQLDAHAWLECHGKVLLGEATPGRYLTICALAGSTPRGCN